MANEFAHVTVGVQYTQAEFEAVQRHKFNSQATGDIMYASSADQLSRLPKGTQGYPLVMGGSSVPQWGGSILIEGGTFTFNEAGANYDFRAESVNNPNMLVVDAGEDRVAIGGAAYSGFLSFLEVQGHAKSADAGEGIRRSLFGSDYQVTPVTSASIVCTVEIREPNIAGAVTPTKAASLYILNAPSEGASNAAIWVNAGDMKFGGSVDSASVADQVALGGYEISAGNRALAISQEAAVAVDADETKFSHKLPVRINGSTYNIMLTTT